MRKLWMLSGLVLLAGCAPADEQYCQQFGVDGTTEYGKCIRHFHEQEAAFDVDRGICDAEADRTYPPTLYDRGGYTRSFGGFGPHGQFYGSRTVRVDPDWHHNRQVDALRMRIIEPCMQARGWNTGQSWEAGRRPVMPAKKKAAANQKLPWQR